MAGQAHHRDPQFIRTGRIVRAAANANPRAICWRCGLTLAQHAKHKTGKPARWQAGHTIDGVNGPAWLHVTTLPPKGVALIAPEASTCNTSHGASAGNRRRGTGYTWP